MKHHTSHRLRGIAALAGLALAPIVSQANVLSPIGELELERTMVRSHTKVQVSWRIVYPPDLGELLLISPTGGFKTQQDLDLTLRAIGMEYKRVSHDNGHGNNDDSVDVTNPGRGGGGPNGEIDRNAPLDDELQTNGNLKETTLDLDATLWIAENGSWQELFQGGASDLQGGQLYYASSLPMGTSVDLAAQGQSKHGSNQLVSTTDPGPSLVALKDGDPLPSGVGVLQGDTIAAFLSPYVKDGHIQLGPTQLLYLFDLDAAPGSRDFTLQDVGVLVSVKPNEKRTIRTRD